MVVYPTAPQISVLGNSMPGKDMVTVIKTACNSWFVGYIDLPSEVTSIYSVLLTAAIVT